MNKMTLAIFAIGDTEVALAASATREAVEACSVKISAPAPQAAAWSLGSIILRGSPVPLIDLSAWLGVRQMGAISRQHKIVVVHAENRVFGFIVDRVCGVVEASANDLYDIHDTRSNRVTRCFLSLDNERTVYVLDLTAILALKGNIQTTYQGYTDTYDSSNESATDTIEPGIKRRAALIESNGLQIALPLESIREIRQTGSVSPPAVVEASYLGHIDWRDCCLPLFNIGPLIDREPAKTVGAYCLIVTMRSRLIAIAVERVIGTIDFDPVESRDGYPAHEYLLKDPSYGAVWLIGPARLWQATTVANLAVENDQTRDRNVAQVWHRYAFFAFEAGARYTVPIEALTAIQRYPDEITDARQDTPFIGYFVKNGAPVALVDLRVLLGHTNTARAEGDVLIVGNLSKEEAVGFIVNTVDDMTYIEAPVDSYVEHWRGDRETDTSPIDACKQLVSLGYGERLSFLSILRLDKLAQALWRQAKETTHSTRTESLPIAEIADN